MSTPVPETSPAPPSPRAAVADVLPVALVDVVRYTAGQIAGVLGISGNAVHQALADAPRDADREVRGQMAKAWSLPVIGSHAPRLHRRLAEVAGARGIPVEDLLDGSAVGAAARRWQPPLAWDKVAPAFRSEAEQYRAALQEALARQHEFAHDRAGWLALAGAGCVRVLGRAVPDARLEYVLTRATQRDQNYGEFHRPELFLEDAAFRVPVVAVTDRQWSARFEPLARLQLTNAAQPTVEDRAWIFHCAFKRAEGLERTLPAAATRGLMPALAGYLETVFPPPTLARNLPSLRRMFYLNRRRWEKGGKTPAALADQRGNSGQKAYCCEPCLKLVNHIARGKRGHGGLGNMSLGFREAWNLNLICETCREHFRVDMERNKSYVPPLLSPERHAHHSGEGAGRGPRHAQLTGPYTPRDWGDVVPGDWFCADDETPNQIVFEYVDDELVIGRAQNIEAIDARCDYPLDFYLYIGAPTGLAIRRLMWKVMVDGVGLPDKGWNLERGVFRSRIVAGEDAIPFRDIEAGLLDQFGVRVGESDLPETERGIGEAGVATTHATTPRAKVIEGYFHTTQKLTSDLHGFAGFCEREEIPDHLKEFVARCKVGKEDPQGRRI